MADPLTKSELRRALRDHRGTRGDGERTAAGGALAAHADELRAATIAAFVGVRTEPPTLALLGALVGAGRRVLLPVLREDLDLEWAELTEVDALRGGRLGTREPVGRSLGREAIGEAQLVLAPALAVDRAGGRLGQGGGSYDRALGRTTATVLAVVFDDEVLDAVPVEPHDRRVDGALTPGGGIMRFAGAVP